jgi:hypothetical protein
MSDDATTRDEASEEAPLEGDEAGAEMSAEAAEAAAAEAKAEAHEDRVRTKVAWSLVQPQVFALLLANCLFFAGVLAAWSRPIPGAAWDPTLVSNGLHSIGGSIIFTLSIYGFWTCVFNIWRHQAKIWPFLINALIGLWIGVGAIASTVGSDAWDQAIKNLEAKAGASLADELTWRMATVPPGKWLLTLGGVLVLILLIRGVMSGAASAKARASTTRRR